MQIPIDRYGIRGQTAPELEVARWIDASGAACEPLYLADFDAAFKIMYCFQSWCPGCHSNGFPTLSGMRHALQGRSDIVFFVVQTVFEGFDANSFDAMLETQEKYDLQIPFGHDPGTEGSISNTMRSYRTGGTPWFVFIDKSNQVVFNDFHLDANRAVDFLKNIA